MANSSNTQATASPSAGNKMQWLDALNRADVSHATFRVAYTIAMHANWDGTGPNGWSCYPSIKTIAQGAGCTRKTVSACLSTLADHGWLSVQSGGFIDGRNISNQYSLTIVGSVLKTLGVASSGRPECSPEDALPTSSTNSNNQLPGEAAHDAPSSHLADSDLSVATTRSAVQHEGHGEDEHDEQGKLSSGTSGDAAPPAAASASQEQAKEEAEDPRRLNGRALLAHRWGEEAATRAVQLSMQCAGGLMSEELVGLLSDVDEEFADWCSDYGSRIASRAAWSEREAAGILASKLRTFDRGMWLAA